MSVSPATSKPPLADERAAVAPDVEPWRNDPVNLRLRSILLRQRLFNVLTLFLAALLLVLCWLNIAMCFDRLWEFSQGTRELMLAGAIGTLGAALTVLAFLLLFKRLHPLFHARAIDRALGYEDDALVTYVELRRAATRSETDAEIAGLLKGQVLQRVNFIDADQVIDTRPLGRFMWGAGAAALFMAILFFAWGRTFSDSIYRCIAPWRNIDPPRSTLITSVSPGNGLAVSGEPVTFSITARSADLPTDAVLVYQIAGEQNATEERLPKKGSENFEKELPGFVRPLTYWVRCNDAKQGPFELKIVERPMVTGVNVRVLPPAYASSSPVRNVAGGHVQAILGSRLQITAAVNQAPRKQSVLHRVDTAWLQAGVARLPMTAEGNTLSATVDVLKAFEYKIGYIDNNELASREGILYQVKALADQPPHAILRRQTGSESLPAGAADTVHLIASASDDLGVASLALRVSIVGADSSKRRTIDCSPTRLEQNIDKEVRLNLAPLALNAGDEIECVLVAEDSKKPVAQKAESPALRIHIVAAGLVAPEKTAPPPSPPSQPQESPRELVRPSDSKPQENKALEDLTEQQQELLRELSRLASEQSDEKAKERLADLAGQQEKLADELIALAEQQQANGAGEKEEQPAAEAPKPENPAEASKNADNSGASQNSNAPGSEKSRQNSAPPQSGSPQDKSQENPGGESGKDKASQKGGGANQAGGSESGESGKEQSSAAGQPGSQQAGGQGQQSGQGQGQGQGNQGDGKSQGSGQKSSSGLSAGNGESGGSGAGAPGGGTGNNGGEMKASADRKAARQALSDAAKLMREGDRSDETLKKIQTAFDHLFGAGRAFNKKDIERLKKLNAQDAGPHNQKAGVDDTRGSGPTGRARGDLSKGLSATNGQTKPGELKEDDLGRTTEKGRVKIAPEYQKALQDYYKQVSQ